MQALLQGDSLQESHHRDAMRLLAASGQTAAAFRQFETSRALLAAELGLQPMAETLALATALRGPAALPVSSASLIPVNSATPATQANAVAWVIPVAEALAALGQAVDAVVVTLAPLPPQAVYQLVQSLSGAADPVRFAERLSRATGGNAYFIAETLRDLAESAVLMLDADGRWRTAFDQVTQDYRELPLAPSVRDAVLGRVQRLGPAAARVLEAAALAGEPFGAAMLASACALSEMDTLATLDQAAVAHLLRAHDEGGYGWGHDLVQQALESALAPARRRLMHHRLALAAEALGRSAAAALHFEACGEAPRAAPHRLAAGDAAEALQAVAEALRHWRQGLADAPGLVLQAELLVRLRDAVLVAGHADEAQAYLERLQPLLATSNGAAWRSPCRPTCWHAWPSTYRAATAR